jgi:hypothetical protein
MQRRTKDVTVIAQSPKKIHPAENVDRTQADQAVPSQDPRFAKFFTPLATQTNGTPWQSRFHGEPVAVASKSILVQTLGAWRARPPVTAVIPRGKIKSA